MNNKMKNNLLYDKNLKRNINESIFTIVASLLTIIAILPILLVLSYVIYKGISIISISVLTELPEPPGDDLISAGGIGNAILGTLIVTSIATFISVPIGVGGGIYLAEYSKGKSLAKFIRFGTNVLAAVPSIIAGVFIYIIIVSTKLILNSNFSALAGGLALSILMLPTIVKTTDEGLKLVPNDLRHASLGIGASKFTTITQITLPAALSTISTGIILAIARAAGETAPLIFTALFSFYWPSINGGLFEPIASLSVLIYNFALEPYEAQNQLAWAASIILVSIVVLLNLFSRRLKDSSLIKSK